jgi:hypothetical protein
MSGYAGMCVAALIAAPELPGLTGTARIVVVMIALNIFVASFPPGSISRRSRKVHVHRPGWTYECPRPSGQERDHAAAASLPFIGTIQAKMRWPGSPPAGAPGQARRRADA